MQDRPPAGAPPDRGPSLIRGVPNALTTIRLVLGIAFPLISKEWRIATVLIAAATEFLDGALARLLRVPSRVGRVLDPIADKVFILAALATLLAEGVVTSWQLALVASRDLIVAAGVLWVAACRGVSSIQRMPPSALGKLATASQLLLLFTLVASRQINLALLSVTAMLSLAAGIHYVWRSR